MRRVRAAPGIGYSIAIVMESLCKSDVTLSGSPGSPKAGPKWNVAAATIRWLVQSGRWPGDRSSLLWLPLLPIVMVRAVDRRSAGMARTVSMPIHCCHHERWPGLRAVSYQEEAATATTTSAKTPATALISTENARAIGTRPSRTACTGARHGTLRFRTSGRHDVTSATPGTSIRTTRTCGAV